MISAIRSHVSRSPRDVLRATDTLLELLETDTSLELEPCEYCNRALVTTYHVSSRDRISADLESVSVDLWHGSNKQSATVSNPAAARIYGKGAEINNRFVAGAANCRIRVCRSCAPRAERFAAGRCRILNPDLPILEVSDTTRPDSALRFSDLDAAETYCRKNKGPAPRKARKARSSSSSDKCSSSRAGSGIVKAADARAIARAALELLDLEMPETADQVPAILEALELERTAAEIVKRETGAADPYAAGAAESSEIELEDPERFAGADLR